MSIEEAKRAKERAHETSRKADLAQAMHDRATELLAMRLTPAERLYFEELQSYLYAFRSVHDAEHAEARKHMERALEKARKEEQ